MLLPLPLHGVTCVTRRYSAFLFFAVTLDTQARLFAPLVFRRNSSVVLIVYNKPAPIPMLVEPDNPGAAVCWISTPCIRLFKFSDAARNNFKRNFRAAGDCLWRHIHDAVNVAELQQILKDMPRLIIFGNGRIKNLGENFGEHSASPFL